MVFNISAEEVGLKGSQAVAEAYAAEEKVIVGMMQLDMTFYVGTGDENVVGVVTDNVDDSLTAFTRQLVESYCTIPWQNTVVCIIILFHTILDINLPFFLMY